MYIPGDIRSERSSGITRITTSPRPIKLGIILLIDKIEEPVDLELDFPFAVTLTDEDLDRFNYLVGEGGDYENFYYFCTYGNIYTDENGYLNIFEGRDGRTGKTYVNSTYSPIGSVPFVFSQLGSNILFSLSKYPVDITAGLGSYYSNYYLPILSGSGTPPRDYINSLSGRAAFIRDFYLKNLYPLSLVLVALWLIGYEFPYQGRTYKLSDYSSFKCIPYSLSYPYIGFGGVERECSIGNLVGVNFIPRYVNYEGENNYYLFGDSSLSLPLGTQELKIDVLDYTNDHFKANFIEDGNLGQGTYDYYELPSIGSFKIPSRTSFTPESITLTGSIRNIGP